MRRFIKRYWDVILVVVVFAALALAYPKFSVTLTGSWAWSLIAVPSLIALNLAMQFIKLAIQHLDSYKEFLKEKDGSNGRSN